MLYLSKFDKSIKVNLGQVFYNSFYALTEILEIQVLTYDKLFMT